MYQSLLFVLKPLVFEGKSGVLKIVHKYDDTALVYLKEGIVEQVETKTLQGKKAASACIQWLSVETSFNEGVQGGYTPDAEIETTSLLSFLEKTAKNIRVINDKIPDENIVLRIDSSKLQSAKKLGADDIKMAMLFDGRRTIAQVVSISDFSELAVLTRTCRLLLSGVAREAVVKDVMPEKERTDFLSGLRDKLTDLIGPAGEVLVDDAFESTGLRPSTLAKEDLLLLLSAIGELLDPEENELLKEWGKQFM